MNKTKIILLTTQKKVNNGEIHYDINGNLSISSETNRAFTGNHLYFLSDEEIKDGDWCVVNSGGGLKTVVKVSNGGLNLINKSKVGKIIATTDKKLTKCSYCNMNHFYDHNIGCDRPKDSYHRIKLITESFVKKYVSCDGKIDDTELEVVDGHLKITKDFEVIIKGEDVRKYEIDIVDKEFEQTVKPPIGLISKLVSDKERLNEVRGAIVRYHDAELKIPVEWIEEYNELIDSTRV